MIDGNLNDEQLKTLRKIFKSLDMPPKKRQRLLWRIARYGVIDSSKRYARNQQTPDGEKWPSRQSAWKKKMLRKLPSHLHIKEMPEVEAARVYLQGGDYKNGSGPVPAGVVGYSQQKGMNHTIRKSSYEKTNKQKPKKKAEPEKNTDSVSDEAPATIAQAKKLRKLGYSRRNGKGWKKVPYKTILETLTFGQAGLIIRKMKKSPPKESWNVKVPARPFLGINQIDFNKALERQLQGINFGWNVKAQDMKRRN